MPDADEIDVTIRSNDVAVIGMCGRFPGAPDLDAFWSRLRAGDDMLTTYTDDELVAAGVPERVLRDPHYVRRAASLPDAFDFDPEFFGYTRREAKLIDPQQRLMLEVAWELLDTIGYSGGADDQAVGVFAGAAMNTYLTNVVARSCDLLTYDGIELMVANDKDYLTTRISYKLGLKGPSVNVQTACSTSLVAVHMAAQSLIAGECDIALAGGVSVIANAYPGYIHGEGMMFSPDGRCRPFDADAAGTTFGDGVGLVALKRLAEAIEDGDRILAVLKGSAINNDGSDKIGYTAPSVEGQRAVISEAHAVAGVDSDTITYVEAHGTATALGDPIEFTALSEAFVDGGAQPGQCAPGSPGSSRRCWPSGTGRSPATRPSPGPTHRSSWPAARSTSILCQWHGSRARPRGGPRSARSASAAPTCTSCWRRHHRCPRGRRRTPVPGCSR
jgi:acyl transferase domain-containing protein